MSGRRFHMNGGKVQASQMPVGQWVPALVQGAETMELHGKVWSFKITRPPHRIGPGRRTWYTGSRRTSKYLPRDEDAKHANIP